MGVKSQAQILSLQIVIALRALRDHAPAQGIAAHPLADALPAQAVLEDQFQTFQPLVVDIHKTEDLSGQMPVGIDAFVLRLQIDPRKSGFLDLLGHAQIHLAPDPDKLPILPQQGLNSGRGHIHVPGQDKGGLRLVANGAGIDPDRGALQAAGQDVAVPVQDSAAHPFHQFRAGIEAPGPGGEIRPLDDLQLKGPVPQPSPDEGEKNGHAPEAHPAEIRTRPKGEEGGQGRFPLLRPRQTPVAQDSPPGSGGRPLEGQGPGRGSDRTDRGARSHLLLPGIRLRGGFSLHPADLAGQGGPQAEGGGFFDQDGRGNEGGMFHFQLGAQFLPLLHLPLQGMGPQGKARAFGVQPDQSKPQSHAAQYGDNEQEKDAALRLLRGGDAQAQTLQKRGPRRPARKKGTLRERRNILIPRRGPKESRDPLSPGKEQAADAHRFTTSAPP